MEGNGQAHQVQVQWPPVEVASVGTENGPDGKVWVFVEFRDVQGGRKHFLDAKAAKTIGEELARLSGFAGAGLTIPPRG